MPCGKGLAKKKKLKSVQETVVLEDPYRTPSDTVQSLAKQSYVNSHDKCVCMKGRNEAVGEWDYFGAWCSCQNSRVTKYLVKKCRMRKKDKVSNESQDRISSFQENGDSNGGLERFYHHNEMQKYAQQYRMFHCLQYLDDSGQWVSLAKLASRQLEAENGEDRMDTLNRFDTQQSSFPYGSSAMLVVPYKNISKEQF